MAEAERVTITRPSDMAAAVKDAVAGGDGPARSPVDRPDAIVIVRVVHGARDAVSIAERGEFDP